MDPNTSEGTKADCGCTCEHCTAQQHDMCTTGMCTMKKPAEPGQPTQPTDGAPGAPAA